MNQSQDWVVGIIAPESFYLRGLESTRQLLVLLSLLVIVAILLGGALTLQAVQRGLSRILAGTSADARLRFRSRLRPEPFSAMCVRSWRAWS